jgi:hypothetical protein
MTGAQKLWLSCVAMVSLLAGCGSSPVDRSNQLEPKATEVAPAPEVHQAAVTRAKQLAEADRLRHDRPPTGFRHAATCLDAGAVFAGSSSFDACFVGQLPRGSTPSGEMARLLRAFGIMPLSNSTYCSSRRSQARSTFGCDATGLLRPFRIDSHAVFSPVVAGPTAATTSMRVEVKFQVSP